MKLFYHQSLISKLQMLRDAQTLDCFHREREKQAQMSPTEQKCEKRALLSGDSIGSLSETT